MIPTSAGFVKPKRREVQVPADRTWDRLCLVMIIETRQIAPTAITADFDQTGSNKDSESKPAHEPDHQNGRPPCREWPWIEQRTKKDGEKGCLEQLRFPSIAVPNS